MFINYWVYAVLYIFFTIIIGQFYIEDDLKLLYYLVSFLLYICLTNVYTTVKYYIKLRNTPGVRGDRGDPGESGIKGSDGVCIMSNNCGIVNCRKLIIDKLTERIKGYKNIRKKLKTNVELNNTEKKIQKKVNNYIDILLPQCESSDKEADEFVKIIDKTLKKS